MSTLPEIHSFWRDRVGPEGYARASRDRAAVLVGILRTLYPDTDPSILEVGCNCGRNLAHLWGAGFLDLAGFDISPTAIEAARINYPKIMADLAVGPAEEVLPEIPDKSRDFIFTMAVLMHIHPASEWIFPHLQRIARRHIVTIECEQSNHRDACGVQRHWARNYRDVFENNGWKQLECRGSVADLKLYTLRIFERQA